NSPWRIARRSERNDAARGHPRRYFYRGVSREGTMTTGMLSLSQLRKAVGEGTIDTVVAAFPDMQGRLMGKRFHAQYFADGGHEETHGCNYLLANDIDMEPVPGYRAASWEKGYG